MAVRWLGRSHALLHTTLQKVSYGCGDQMLILYRRASELDEMLHCTYHSHRLSSFAAGHLRYLTSALCCNHFTRSVNAGYTGLIHIPNTAWGVLVLFKKFLVNGEELTNLGLVKCHCSGKVRTHRVCQSVNLTNAHVWEPFHKTVQPIFAGQLRCLANRLLL